MAAQVSHVKGKRGVRRNQVWGWHMVKSLYTNDITYCRVESMLKVKRYVRYSMLVN